jgi:hypothetical protein
MSDGPIVAGASPDRSRDGAESVQGVSVELWRRLFDVAEQFRRLAPWKWMADDAIFGVRLPGTDTIGFVNVMGAAGKHRACAVYLGWQALYDLLQALAQGGLDFEAFLEIPQLQLGLESRDDLRPVDLQPVRALGLRFRGPQAWPVFRSHRVGYLPWLVDAAEAAWLHTAVYQSLGMAMRLEDNPRLLQPEQPGTMLVRGPDAAGVWQDEWLPVPRPPDRRVAVVMDRRRIDALRRKPAGENLQVDLLLSRAVIGHRNERPQTAYLLLIVDAASGFILNVEMMQALEGVDAMWGTVPNLLLRSFQKLGGYPRSVEVRGERMMNVLRPLSEQLPFRLTRCSRLAQVDAARESFDAFFGDSPLRRS